jgi:hypothetical protein
MDETEEVQCDEAGRIRFIQIEGFGGGPEGDHGDVIADGVVPLLVDLRLGASDSGIWVHGLSSFLSMWVGV